MAASGPLTRRSTSPASTRHELRLSDVRRVEPVATSTRRVIGRPCHQRATFTIGVRSRPLAPSGTPPRHHGRSRVLRDRDTGPTGRRPRTRYQVPPPIPRPEPQPPPRTRTAHDAPARRGDQRAAPASVSPQSLQVAIARQPTWSGERRPQGRRRNRLQGPRRAVPVAPGRSSLCSTGTAVSNDSQRFLFIRRARGDRHLTATITVVVNWGSEPSEEMEMSLAHGEPGWVPSEVVSPSAPVEMAAPPWASGGRVEPPRVGVGPRAHEEGVRAHA